MLVSRDGYSLELSLEAEEGWPGENAFQEEETAQQGR